MQNNSTPFLYISDKKLQDYLEKVSGGKSLSLNDQIILIQALRYHQTITRITYDWIRTLSNDTIQVVNRLFYNVESLTRQFTTCNIIDYTYAHCSEDEREAIRDFLLDRYIN
jgi:hypothetical protein